MARECGEEAPHSLYFRVQDTTFLKNGKMFFMIDMKINKMQAALDTISYVRQQAECCILFNSCGKDSLVMLDLVAPRFRRVVCVFMYFVKGLEHVERFLQSSAMKYPNVEVFQTPHWNLSYVRRGGMYCITDPKQKLLKLRDVVNMVREEHGNLPVFLGMKKADSMNRRLMLNTYEANHYTNAGLAYPLATWTQKEVLAYMRQHHLPAPIRYGRKASNGIGFNLDCYLWMEQNAPQDLLRMYQEFPLSHRILFEYHYNNPEIQLNNN